MPSRVKGRSLASMADPPSPADEHRPQPQHDRAQDTGQRPEEHARPEATQRAEALQPMPYFLPLPGIGWPLRLASSVTTRSGVSLDGRPRSTMSR
jgi:hypothetical protein